MNSTPHTSQILVVDDDPRNRKLLEEYLLGAGYGVRVAADGRTALAMAAERPPDLVLLDVMMPDLSGLEVCRQLKNEPRTRLCQVVLVTALDGVPQRVEGLDTGADDYRAPCAEGVHGEGALDAARAPADRGARRGARGLAQRNAARRARRAERDAHADPRPRPEEPARRGARQPGARWSGRPMTSVVHLVRRSKARRGGCTR